MQTEPRALSASVWFGRSRELCKSVDARTKGDGFVSWKKHRFEGSPERLYQTPNQRLVVGGLASFDGERRNIVDTFIRSSVEIAVGYFL